MRILKVVQAYYPFQEKGGPVVKVRALAKGLVQRGHSVTVLTADLGLGDGAAYGMKVEPVSGGWRWEQDGIETVYLKTRGHYRALTINPSVFAFCRSQLNRFDLVHFYGLYDLLSPAVAHRCWERRIPYVVEPMGMYRPIDRSLQLKRLWHRTLGKSFLKRAALFVVTSELEYKELLDGGIPPSKLVVRYNGIDPSLYSAPPPRGAFRSKHAIPGDQTLILFLSRLIPRKGADILIEAFASVCPDSGWLVIAGPEGEPGYLRYLESCANKSGVAGRILFTGPVYDREKNAMLVDADIFALPSRYENFANVAAEAIACSVPVVITPFCGIAALVNGEAGLIVTPDRHELADALRRMIYDRDLYRQLKEGCRRVAEQLDWDHLVEEMEVHYGSALESGAAVAAANL